MLSTHHLCVSRRNLALILARYLIDIAKGFCFLNATFRLWTKTSNTTLKMHILCELYT